MGKPRPVKIANIDMKNSNLLDTLKNYVSSVDLVVEKELKFGWGIDFAYCAIPNIDKGENKILIACDNHDGTAVIEATEIYEKYRKLNRTA